MVLLETIWRQYCGTYGVHDMAYKDRIKKEKEKEKEAEATKWAQAIRKLQDKRGFTDAELASLLNVSEREVKR